MSGENGTNKSLIFNTQRLAVTDCAFLSVKAKVQLASAIRKLLSPGVVKALPADWKDIKSLEQTTNWLEERLAESQLFAVSRISIGEIIGLIFVHETKGADSSISLNIGYLLGEQHWGKGYATEILAALVSYYRNQSNVSRLIAGVEIENAASIKVLKKCGFKISALMEAPQGNLFYEIVF